MRRMGRSTANGAASPLPTSRFFPCTATPMMCCCRAYGNCGSGELYRGRNPGQLERQDSAARRMAIAPGRPTFTELGFALRN